MATSRTRLLIAAACVAAFSAATLLGFGAIGCDDAGTTEASTQYMTPGVYIVSVASFGTGFADFVRDVNPACG